MAAVWVAALVAVGCATPRFPEEHAAVFQQAVEASQSENPARAAAAAHHYLDGVGIDDPRYDRALRVLAKNAERLGLSYAASLWYLDIARSRRDVQLVDEAVAGLERIMQNYPYDRETILQGFVASADISGLPPKQKAFVAYYQGLDSLQEGEEKFALQSFDSIPKESPYRARARYALAVREIAQMELDRARSVLETLADEELPRDLETKVYRGLARTEFEERDYDAALDYYRQIQDRAPTQPRLLLEMAWSHFYLGNYRRALGLLVALDAPAYRELIAPRRYLLEARALRKLCQYGPARTAAVRLQQRHGAALDDLRRGVPLEESKPLREAAGLRAGGRAVADFRDRVERERRRIDELRNQLGNELAGRLEEIYAQGLQKVQRRERRELRDEMRELAGELLSAREGVRLILHELGVALLRGQRRSSRGTVERRGAGFSEKTVRYEFAGEFWTDEVDDLVVDLEDRCIED